MCYFARLSQASDGVPSETWLHHHEDGGLSLCHFKGEMIAEHLTIIMLREDLSHLAFVLLKERLSGRADAGEQLLSLLRQNAILHEEIGD